MVFILAEHGFSALLSFCIELLHRINAETEDRMLPLAETATVPPSLVTVHVELVPPSEAVGLDTCAHDRSAVSSP
jgi:hypothetical protein